MKRLEVEARVHRIIDDVLAGRPAEDDSIECKAQWPDEFQRAARRVAGHANSARSESIVWVIGVDQKGRELTGAADVDPASWCDQLRSHFADSWAPPVNVYVIPRGDRNVVALVFATGGAPFLVKTGGPTLEVPWRDATGTRSAKRHELISMLSEAVRVPVVDVIACDLGARGVWPGNSGRTAYSFSVALTLYVARRSGEPLHLPMYRVTGSVQLRSWPESIEMQDLTVRTVNGTVPVDGQVDLTSPVLLTVNALASAPIAALDPEPAVVRVQFGIAGTAQDLEIVAELRGRTRADGGKFGDSVEWTMPPGAFRSSLM